MEKIFREWNEGPVFAYERRITFGRCDMYGRIKLSELLMLISDAAGEDYTRRGLSHDVLEKSGVFFLVSRMSIHVLNKIKGEACVTVKTWENSIKGARFNRYIEICDEDGTPLVHAKTVWLAVNTDTRKIIRPADYPYMDRVALCDKDVDCMECGKIDRKNTDHDFGERVIRFSDIDANGHVNNTRYAEFAEDCLSSKVMEQAEHIDTVRINFINEAKLGDRLDLKGGYNREKKCVVVLGTKDDTVSFECEFYLK